VTNTDNRIRNVVVVGGGSAGPVEFVERVRQVPAGSAEAMPLHHDDSDRHCKAPAA
jgi:hypothetical protein